MGRLRKARFEALTIVFPQRQGFSQSGRQHRNLLDQVLANGPPRQGQLGILYTQPQTTTLRHTGSTNTQA